MTTATPSASAAAPTSTATFEQHRRRLWGLAYRMLGARDEADDIVQEAWLRWARAGGEDVRTPEAWLVTTTTRLCIDRLRELRAERESYTGPWLPEPLLGEAPPADAATELASDLSVAFLALLERMSPEERAALLLHDVFDTDYADIAQILGKSEAACRQLVSRARKSVHERRPRVQVNPAANRELLHGLVRAIQSHDAPALLALLAKDATWTSDGGGRAKAARKTIHGAERIARFATGVFRHVAMRVQFEDTLVNGEPGIAIVHEGRLFAAITVRTDGRRILDVYGILNPDKLRERA